MRSGTISGYKVAERITTAQLKEELAKKATRKSKYKNRITEVDGHKFHSAKEANYYRTYKALEKRGVIRDLELQPRFDIVINGQKVGFYKADFAYRDKRQEGRHIGWSCKRIIDVKGIDTALSRFKRKCVEALYGIKVEIV